MKKILTYFIAGAFICACSDKGDDTFRRPGGDDSVKAENAFDVKIGEPLPAWEEGVLDIHAINSGRGECTFFVLPDGTSMVVDAGEFVNYSNADYKNVPQKPSTGIRPYKVYADYISHFLPKDNAHIDYFVTTHYHMDHIGRTESGFEKDPAGGYVLTGVSGLHSLVPISKILDRSYPDYSANIHSDSSIGFYETFVNWNVKNRGMQAEKFSVGSTDQIVLKRNASAYDFKVLNLAANGVAWDGTKEVATNITAENAASCAFLLSYGSFDYFTSGDLNNNTVCKNAAQGVGRRIEAMKCHHHMSNETPFNTENAVYNPRVIVTQSFYQRTEQPQQSIISANSALQAMFFTNVVDAVVATAPSVYKDAKSLTGHVVIRVDRGGDKFFVYTLGDDDQEYVVKGIFGPYECFK